MAQLNKRLLNQLSKLTDDIKVNSLTTYSIPYSKTARLYITEFPENMDDLFTSNLVHKPGFFLKYAGLPAKAPFEAVEGLSSRELMKKLKEVLK